MNFESRCRETIMAGSAVSGRFAVLCARFDYSLSESRVKVGCHKECGFCCGKVLRSSAVRKLRGGEPTHTTNVALWAAPKFCRRRAEATLFGRVSTA